MEILLLIVQILTLIALAWYTIETYRLRKGNESFQRRERQIDFFFNIARQDEPSATDRVRYLTRHIVPIQADAVATVANLGKLSIVVRGIEIRKPAERASKRTFATLPLPLPQGSMEQFIIADYLARFLRDTGLVDIQLPPAQRAYAGELEIRLMFYCRKAPRASDWHRYAIGLNHDAVQTIHRVKHDVQVDVRIVKSAI